MNEVILSGLGILLALCGMTVLIFRRVSPIIVGPLAALLVTVMSGLPVLDSVTGIYVAGVGSFFVSYFMIFLLGNILGSLYQISGAAAKIGETVVRWFGAKNCMVACLISAALLSYGGINSFVIIFAIYPIALKLFEEADLPTYLLPGIVCGGMWTFAMTGPFSPQICNIVSMQSLGTPSYAGLIPGLAASVVMAVLIVWYMNRQAKKAKGRGEHFTPPEGGVRQHEGPTPGTVVSFIPLTAVIVLFNVTEIGIVACLLIGIVLSLGLFWRSIPWGEMLSTMNQAAQLCDGHHQHGYHCGLWCGGEDHPFLCLGGGAAGGFHREPLCGGRRGQQYFRLHPRLLLRRADADVYLAEGDLPELRGAGVQPGVYPPAVLARLRGAGFHALERLHCFGVRHLPHHPQGQL